MKINHKMKLLLSYIMGFLFMVIIGAECAAMVGFCARNYSLGTVKQRHDFVKSIIGNLDDVVVADGFISDKTLHKIGASLGICTETPGELD